jgi:GNAT superfamily N-acetyltransferase
MRLEIVRLADGSDLEAVRFLVRGLRDHLLSKGVPIESFQSLEDEISGLPGKYAEEKKGCLLVARLVPGEPGPEAEEVSLPLPVFCMKEELQLPLNEEEVKSPTKPVVIGIVAIKDISSPEPYKAEEGQAEGVSLESTCEMKRLFVLPFARGHRCGERLCKALLRVAGPEDKGYSTMKLDSLDRLPEACRIYEKLGFTRCAPYVFNPMPDARYYSFDLKGHKAEDARAEPDVVPSRGAGAI